MASAGFVKKYALKLIAINKTRLAPLLEIEHSEKTSVGSQVILDVKGKLKLGT
jgi:hypothetical protein